MTKLSPISVGYIGCGAVVQRSHLPAIQEIKTLAPSALIDHNRVQADALGGEFNVSMVTSDLDQALPYFDLAVVATPSVSHYELGKKLLLAGKHVLMEKPLATTFEQGKDLVELAAKNDLILATSLVRRYLPHFRSFKKMMDMQVVGEIQSFLVEEGGVFNWPVQSIDFYDFEKSGGGVLMDNGAHLLDAVLWWFGAADLLEYHDDNRGGVEADCCLDLVLKSGAKGTIRMSRLRQLSNRIVVIGEKGQVAMELGSGEVRLSDLDGNPIFFGHADAAESVSTIDLFTEQYSALYNAIASNISSAPGIVTGSDCLDSIRLIQTCYERRQETDSAF